MVLLLFFCFFTLPQFSSFQQTTSGHALLISDKSHGRRKNIKIISKLMEIEVTAHHSTFYYLRDWISFFLYQFITKLSQILPKDLENIWRGKVLVISQESRFSIHDKVVFGKIKFKYITKIETSCFSIFLFGKISTFYIKHEASVFIFLLPNSLPNLNIFLFFVSPTKHRYLRC